VIHSLWIILYLKDHHNKESLILSLRRLSIIKNHVGMFGGLYAWMWKSQAGSEVVEGPFGDLLENALVLFIDDFFDCVL
jgi:hypothetical protein